jgi:hypothetical protein
MATTKTRTKQTKAKAKPKMAKEPSPADENKPTEPMNQGHQAPHPLAIGQSQDSWREREEDELDMPVTPQKDTGTPEY